MRNTAGCGKEMTMPICKEGFPIRASAQNAHKMARAIPVCAMAFLAACTVFFDDPSAAEGAREMAAIPGRLEAGRQDAVGTAQALVRAASDAAAAEADATVSTVSNAARSAKAKRLAGRGPDNDASLDALPSPTKTNGTRRTMPGRSFAPVPPPPSAAGAAPPSGTAAPRMPALSFEKTGDDRAAPRLTVRGADGLIVLLDGENIGRGDFSIREGEHSLRVFYKADAPLSAEFFVENGDRVVLNGAADDDVPASGRRRDAAPSADPAKAGAFLASAPAFDAALPRSAAKTPVLTFDWVGAAAAQLAIQNMGNAKITINGRRLGEAGIMGLDRMITIQPGSHKLEVISSHGPPFIAHFHIEAGERATLRGQ